MYELKKIIRKLRTRKSVGTGPPSYKKRIYQAAVSQSLGKAALDNLIFVHHVKELMVFYGSQNSLLTQMASVHTSSKLNDNNYSHLRLNLNHDILLSILALRDRLELQYFRQQI